LNLSHPFIHRSIHLASIHSLIYVHPYIHHSSLPSILTFYSSHPFIYLHPSIHIHIHLSIHPFIDIFINTSISLCPAIKLYLYIHHTTHPSIHRPIHPSINPYIYQFIFLPTDPSFTSIKQSITPSIHPFILPYHASIYPSSLHPFTLLSILSYRSSIRLMHPSIHSSIHQFISIQPPKHRFFITPFQPIHPSIHP
jgi:hypothetical protein